ncbi:MAG: hypothetical protein E7225_05515 [Clostridiales bacterium]|nr:hypothetical protein [Clostridiales bacterium]
MEKEDKILIATIEDKLEQAQRSYMTVTSGFLDLRQKELVSSFLKSSPDVVMLKENPDGSVVDVDISGSGRVRTFFYGGYGDAERRVLVILPEYAHVTDVVPDMHDNRESQIDDMNSAEDCPLCILKVRTKGGMSRKLTHRDYLGSLLGLGIKREKVGDILVLDDGADIIVLKELSEFLAVNYEKAGRTNLNVEICDITALDVGKINIEERRDTVASLRLDSLVSSVFGISRGKAQEAIKMGLVFVNSAQISKADMMLGEGDKIVLRGRGKAVLREVAGRSKKDRIYVVFDKYV